MLLSEEKLYLKKKLASMNIFIISTRCLIIRSRLSDFNVYQI